jgi:hypothetical protein
MISSVTSSLNLVKKEKFLMPIKDPDLIDYIIERAEQEGLLEPEVIRENAKPSQEKSNIHRF